MIKTAKFILAVVVIVLAVYGAMKLISCYLLGPSQGEKAVEAVHPFVSGAVSAAGGKLRDSFMNIPDSQLESDPNPRPIFRGGVFLALRPRLGSEISLPCGMRRAVCHVYLERMRSLVILPLFRTDHSPRPHRTPIRA